MWFDRLTILGEVEGKRLMGTVFVLTFVYLSVKLLIMSFAVIKTGGKQYKVAEGDKVLIEKLDKEAGEEFDFEDVLLVANGSAETAKIGQPLVRGARVHAKIIEQGKAPKKIVFRYHSKTRYKKKKGHRQPFTKVEILKITPN